jgi:protein involved in polysaccharide export with SLBB domain
MHPSRIIALLALTSLTACQKAPLIPANDLKVEGQLTKIEAQLDRVEESLVRLAEAEARREATKSAEEGLAVLEAPAKRISVYVFGNGVSKPGELTLPEGATVLMAIAASGGPGEFSSNKLTVIRKEKADLELDGIEEWKNFTLQEGDVISLKASAF